MVLIHCFMPPFSHEMDGAPPLGEGLSMAEDFIQEHLKSSNLSERERALLARAIGRSSARPEATPELKRSAEPADLQDLDYVLTPNLRENTVVGRAWKRHQEADEASDAAGGAVEEGGSAWAPNKEGGSAARDDDEDDDVEDDAEGTRTNMKYDRVASSAEVFFSKDPQHLERKKSIGFGLLTLVFLIGPWLVLGVRRLGAGAGASNSEHQLAAVAVEPSPPPPLWPSSSPPPSPPPPSPRPSPPPPPPPCPTPPPPPSPPPSPSPSPPPESPQSVAERINRRYQRAPYEQWTASGALPDAGDCLVIAHWFPDGLPRECLPNC